MEDVKKLVIRFLGHFGLEPENYMYVPIEKEVHIQPFSIIEEKALEEIATSGLEFGFAVKVRDVFGGEPKKELVFLIDENDLDKITMAMQTINLSQHEFSQAHEG